MKKVVKFGGSSLASAQQFSKVKSIITADKHRRYVIPSAPGKRFSGDIKVTDMLYDCYDTAVSGSNFEEKLDKIHERYNEIIAGLHLDLSLDKEFDKIYEYFKNGAGVNYAASRGEYLNGIIMANYLGFEFIDAAEVIFFDENGEFDSEKTNNILSLRLEKADCAVIPGFYGAMPNGTIKTFSRGGSDITGSIVARAVKADLYENWTDVSGFLVTDPHIVENPEPIEIITYRELRELAYMGASVLHDEAIFPVRREGIPINIKNTNDPSAPGTLIVESTCKRPKYTITGIAGKKGFASVNLEKDRMNTEIGFGRRVLSVFEENGISFEHMPSGIDTMSVFVQQSDFEEKEQKILAGLHRNVNPDFLEIHSNIALIAVVGRGMKSTEGTAGKLFTALAKEDINIRMIDQGSSELNIIIGVNEKDFEKAIRAIYHAFITASR